MSRHSGERVISCSSQVGSTAALPAKRIEKLYTGTLVQPTDHEKVPARIPYTHAQDFAISDELLLAILKAFIPRQVNKQHTIGFSCVYVHSTSLNHM
jgi:hypothetical protein